MSQLDTKAPPLTVFKVIDIDKEQSILVCLDTKVSLEAVAALQLKPDDTFICRDSAVDDTTAANLALQTHFRTI